MSRNFKLYRDYYDTGTPLYQKSNIEMKEGLTVLVGCNGIGKSTMLHQLKSSLQKKNIPYVFFDNLMEGGSHSRQQSLWEGNMSFLATAAMSSEGENIVLNMSKLAERLGSFIQTGVDSKGINANKLAKALLKSAGDDLKEDAPVSKERWILLDAVDSGLSVDNIVDLKKLLFNTIKQHSSAIGVDVYIVISANEYEMARGERCFDVYKGQYTEIPTYEDYRTLILNSRKYKEKRQERAELKTKKEKDGIHFEEAEAKEEPPFCHEIDTDKLAESMSKIDFDEIRDFSNEINVEDIKKTIKKFTFENNFSIEGDDGHTYRWFASHTGDMEDYDL